MNTELFLRLPINPTYPTIENGEIINGDFSELPVSSNFGWTTGSNTSINDLYIYNGTCYVSGSSVNDKSIYQIVATNGFYSIELKVIPSVANVPVTGYIGITSGLFINEQITEPGYYIFTNDQLLIPGNIQTTITFHDTPLGVTNIKLIPETYSSVQIDLYDDTIIPLNFNIADIEDFTKRNANYSKTIVIPGTNANNILFKHTHDITTSGGFTLNKGIDCYLLNNGIQTFSGVFLLTKINIENGVIISYEGNLVSNALDLYQKIGDKLLTGNKRNADNLDFSEYNHFLTMSEISGSWAEHDLNGNQIGGRSGAGYVYVPIDKFNKWDSNAAPSNAWKFSEMSPALYIKEIFDKIINDNGYTYKSNFLNTDRFKSLIFPYTGFILKQDPELLKNKLVKLSGVELTPHIPPLTTVFGYDILPFTLGLNHIDILQNGGAIYQPYSNWEYIIPENGFYQYSADLNMILTFQNVSNLLNWYMVNPSAVLNISIVLSYESFASPSPTIYSYLTPLTAYSSQATSFAGAIQWPIALVTAAKSEVLSSYFNAGDKFNLAIVYQFKQTYNGIPTTNINAWNYKDINNNNIQVATALVQNPTAPSTITFSAVENVTQGMNVPCNAILPKDIKQVDFLKSIINMFNLRIDTQTENPSELIIDTWEEYNTNYPVPNANFTAKGVDWTDKVDLNEVEIERPSDLIESNQLFVYDTDVDHFNKLYTEKVFSQTNYGGLLLEAEQKSNNPKTYTTKLIFAPSIHGLMKNPELYNVAPGTEHVKLYSLKNDGSVDTEKKYKPRILQFSTQSLGVGLDPFYIFGDNTPPSVYSFTTYPYATMLDIPNGADTFDLGYGQNPIPNGYWSNVGQFNNPQTWVTFNNLYNVYYKQYLDQLKDIDTRLITMDIYLNPIDIYNIKFYNIVHIDGSYYKINKIIDWTPTNKCKVELLKIVNETIATDTDDVVILPFNTQPISTITGDTINHLYIDLISDELTNNELLPVYLIDAGEVVNPNAKRFYRSDYFVDGINLDTGVEVNIWEIKNGKLK